MGNFTYFVELAVSVINMHGRKFIYGWPNKTNNYCILTIIRTSCDVSFIAYN